MRDVNPRSRERFDLSLDGRQIASVVVGAIVVLGVVFVLGLSVGKQLARSEVRPPTGGAALAALDQAPTTAAAPVRDEALTYHDRLVKERPAAGPAEPVRPAAESAPSSATPALQPPPAAASAPAAPSPAEPVSPTAEPSPAAPAPAPVRAEPPPGSPTGDWCVQLGAANDRAESERLAAKFERFAPRIETAIVQGKTWHRVRVGSFASKAAAERYLKDLSRETGAKGYVTLTR